MTMVACMVGDRSITAAACVEMQRHERCFCPKAAIAIRAVADENELGTEKPGTEAAKKKVRDTLEVLKSRAQDFLRKPAVDRYGGPALRMLRPPPPGIRGGEGIRSISPAEAELAAASPGAKTGGGRPAAAQENAAGAPSTGTSNDSVRREAALVGSAGVSPEGSAEIPTERPRIETRASQGVAEAQRPMPPPQFDEREERHEAAIAAQENSLSPSLADAIRAIRLEPPSEESVVPDKEKPLECKVDGCGYRLRTDNTTGLCGRHSSGRVAPRPAGWKAGGKPLQRGARAPASTPKFFHPPTDEDQPTTPGPLKIEVPPTPAPSVLTQDEVVERLVQRDPAPAREQQFPDLPSPSVLPFEYLVACARELHRKRRQADFALAGEEMPPERRT